MPFFTFKEFELKFIFLAGINLFLCQLFFYFVVDFFIDFFLKQVHAFNYTQDADKIASNGTIIAKKTEQKGCHRFQKEKE